MVIGKCDQLLLAVYGRVNEAWSKTIQCNAWGVSLTMRWRRVAEAGRRKFTFSFQIFGRRLLAANIV